MKYLSYAQPENSTYSMCILVSTLNGTEIEKTYLFPYGVDPNSVVVIELPAPPEGKKKTPVTDMRNWITEELVPALTGIECEYLLITDPEWFKVITGEPKTDANLGYLLPTSFGLFRCLFAPNYRQVFYDPKRVTAKIDQAMFAIRDHVSGTYAAPGADVINFMAFPETDAEIEAWLERLIIEDRPLSCDIEAFSLKHYTSGIGTITFCWNEHEGIAFPVDYVPIEGATEAPFGMEVRNEHRRKLLANFFLRFNQKLLYHAISYDVYVLIYQLFMEHILDTENLLKGLEIMLKNWDCTKLITYFATNSCAGNDLSLKTQVQEYCGNYAMEEIKDITRIPLPELLKYNLIDGLGTWHTYNKHWPTVIADGQQDIYENLFKPCMVDIIQMQLTGMPVNMDRAKEVDAELQQKQSEHLNKIMGSQIIQAFEREVLDVQYAEKKNAEWKKKRIEPKDAQQTFNPNSDPNMRALLFDYLGLPTISLTKTKLPSTDGETVEALINHTDNAEIKELLENLQMFAIVGTLTANFMPAILGAVQGNDGWHYLFGNFNLGGTLSGRLSSSGPNLQNLPSTGKGHPLKLVYAKMIKSCFQAPPGWLFCGIDFESLEDKISALTTKDPNKLAVYQGHIVYAIDIDGTLHHIRDDDTIIYDGQTFTGQKLYERFSSNSSL